MARHAAVTVAHPWQRTARTAVQATLALAVAAPLVYAAATQQDPATATGAAATGLLIAAAVSRVMGLPAVEGFLREYVPWLAADDVAADVVRTDFVPVDDVVAQVDPAGGLRIVAGAASIVPDGTPVTVRPAP